MTWSNIKYIYRSLIVYNNWSVCNELLKFQWISHKDFGHLFRVQLIQVFDETIRTSSDSAPQTLAEWPLVMEVCLQRCFDSCRIVIQSWSRDPHDLEFKLVSRFSHRDLRTIFPQQNWSAAFSSKVVKKSTEWKKYRIIKIKIEFRLNKRHSCIFIAALIVDNL